jgi:type IV pilus assembly protein PilB
MSKSLRQRLEDVLTANGIVSRDQLDKALELQKEKGIPLASILIEQGIVKQEALVELLSTELGIPPINLSRYKVDDNVVKIIPERIARHYRIVPISRLGGDLTVAMSDPLNIFAVDDIKTLTGFKIKPVIAADKDIVRVLDTAYTGQSQSINEILQSAEVGESVEVVADQGVDIDKVTQESQEVPIVKIVDSILAEGLRRRSSDIHIEPYEGRLRVRYRIDGSLHEIISLPKKNQNAVLARIKIISGLDITQNRLPQDGRFRIRFENRDIDFRVSALPVTFGEKVVLRALDRSNLSVGLEKLGFLQGSLNVFMDAVARPYGMILVTGPTGSGKSTTLYSVLTLLNTPERNIITVEDPVEYQVEGITQVHVKHEIGLTFANGLRSILRQSPDVIMVGEIRDSETADIAIKASLTGQLVLSTLHTNDAPGAVTRLMDMGVEPFLIASSLIIVAAQRLLRKICPSCKEGYEYPREILKNIGVTPEKAGGKALYRGKGCSQCNNTGYYGRMGALEVFSIDDTIKSMIMAGASLDELRGYAVKRGMVSLRQDAVEKMLLGMTTPEEVLRVT